MMTRKAKELGALEVGRLDTPGFHAVGGVSGLALKVSDTGARYWILRVMIGGKRRDMGLGGFPDVTLAGARDAAREARAKIKAGIDPIDDAKAKRSALAASRAASVTFSEATMKYIAAKESEWSNKSHASQWLASLTAYAFPMIGKVFVRDIGQAQVMSVIEPLWLTKNVTATRVRARIEKVLDWATVRGYRTGENPARWRGHLESLLAKPNKVQSVEHFPALPFDEIGAFMVKLRQQESIPLRAVEFAILTAVRLNEVTGAAWSEINLAESTWTIPKERMKMDKEHRVALSDEAVAVLNVMPRTSDLIFPSRKGAELAGQVMRDALSRVHGGITIHGFRSTFRDWASERTSYPKDVAEMALAHSIGSKVEEAYRRGDLFEKRRLMMRDWAKFCDTVALPASVTPIRSKAAV
ncbi:tyrosine-type recombinase/integrase [Propionivibrio sp.]|uniref:tyrosine-type recombinase/integrase n=1 Tax=Propionivibrio sp. TaxID=2212460 RepID=UPI003BF3B4B6